MNTRTWKRLLRYERAVTETSTGNVIVWILYMYSVLVVFVGVFSFSSLSLRPLVRLHSVTPLPPCLVSCPYCNLRSIAIVASLRLLSYCSFILSVNDGWYVVCRYQFKCEYANATCKNMSQAWYKPILESSVLMMLCMCPCQRNVQRIHYAKG